VGRYDILKFIWERVPKITSFKCDRSLPQAAICMFKMKIFSTAGVMHMDQIILDKVIGKCGRQFVLVVNTVMNKFQNLISMKFRKTERIKICIIKFA